MYSAKIFLQGVASRYNSIFSYLLNPHSFVPENDPRYGNRKCEAPCPLLCFAHPNKIMYMTFIIRGRKFPRNYINSVWIRATQTII
ncbi:unnamed protein product [Musa textilis]